MNPVFHLFQLQKLDSRLSGNADRLHTIEQLLLQDTKVKHAKLDVDRVADELDTLRKEFVERDEKIINRRNKQEQAESSLYSGTIKNPKELQDLQREIALIKEATSKLEDEQLDTMIKIESSENLLTDIQNKLQIAINEFENENAILIQEKQQITLDNHLLSEERSLVISQVNYALLEEYNGLRIKKKGIAVSQIEDQTCSVCGSTLTPAECQAARSNNGNITCPTCGRILYAD